MQDSKLLLCQTERAAMDGVLQLLPDAEAPTVTCIDGSDRMSLQVLCRGAITWQRLEDLKRAGAEALMVLPVERMLA